MGEHALLFPRQQLTSRDAGTISQRQLHHTTGSLFCPAYQLNSRAEGERGMMAGNNTYHPANVLSVLVAKVVGVKVPPPLSSRLPPLGPFPPPSSRIPAVCSNVVAIVNMAAMF